MGFFNFGSGVIGDPAIINAFDFLDCLKQKKKLEIKEWHQLKKFALSLEIGIYLTVSTLILFLTHQLHFSECLGRILNPLTGRHNVAPANATSSFQ